MATNKIQVIVEAVGADVTQRKIKGVSGATSALGKSGLTAGNSMRNLAGSIAIVQGPLGPVAGRIGALGAVMGRLNVGALALTATFTLVGVALSKTISIGAKYESQMLKLEAIIKSTGGTAGLTSEQIDKFSIKLGKDTLTSANAVREAAGILLSFRSIAGDTFKRTLTLAQDLAATFGGDLKDKTSQLAKALEDPVRNLGALSRSGVTFTNTQRAMIKQMTITGDKLGAQKLILDEVALTVGGAGKGAAGGLAGAVDSLGEEWTNLFVILGNNTGLIDSTTSAFNFLAESIADLSHSIKVLNGESLAVAESELESYSKKYAEVTEQIFRRKVGGISENPIDQVLSMFTPDAELEKDARRYLKKVREIEAQIAKLKGKGKVGEEDGGKPSNLTLVDTSKLAKESDRFLAQLESKNLSAYDRIANKYVDMWQRIAAAHGEGSSQIMALEASFEQFSDDQWERISEKEKAQAKTRLDSVIASLRDREAREKDALDARSKIITAAHDAELISEERKQELISELIEQFNEKRSEKLKDQITEMDEFAKNAARNMQDAFSNFLIDPFNNGLKGMAEGFARMLAKMAADAAAANLARAVFGAGGSGLSGFLSGIFGGGGGLSGSAAALPTTFFRGFAGGGVPPVGVPSIVGERGPELFIPKTAGTIIPNEKLGGSTTVVQHINVSVNQAMPGMEVLIGQAVQEGAKQGYAMVNDDVRRGGPIRAALG